MTRWTANPIERFGKGIPDNLDAGCQWKNGTKEFRIFSLSIQNLCTSDTVKPRLKDHGPLP